MQRCTRFHLNRGIRVPVGPIVRNCVSIRSPLCFRAIPRQYQRRDRVESDRDRDVQDRRRDGCVPWRLEDFSRRDSMTVARDSLSVRPTSR